MKKIFLLLLPVVCTAATALAQNIKVPVTVQTSFNTKFPGAVFSRMEKIEKPGGKILYEVNIKVNGKKKELELNPDGSPEK